MRGPEDAGAEKQPTATDLVAAQPGQFVAGHAEFGPSVTFDTVADVLRKALADGRLAEQQLKWLEGRLDALRDEDGGAPQWSFPISELAVLASFYRRCADRGFAVYAEF